jgi:mRNA interferase MazF
MPGFDAGTIVRVPFPYTHRPVRQHRPALVSDGPIGPDSGLL